MNIQETKKLITFYTLGGKVTKAKQLKRDLRNFMRKVKLSEEYTKRHNISKL